MHYYHFLAQQKDLGGVAGVTSKQIAKVLHLDSSLVRKDLAEIGVHGYPGKGFSVLDVMDAIRMHLGLNRNLRAVIVGAGRLGGALASYRGFGKYGIEICAVFDNAPHKIELTLAGYQIQHVRELPVIVKQMGVLIGIITVPSESAQEAAHGLVDAGVKAIWNFASTDIEVPKGTVVRQEHLSVGLCALAYQIRS